MAHKFYEYEYKYKYFKNVLSTRVLNTSAPCLIQLGELITSMGRRRIDSGGNEGGADMCSLCSHFQEVPRQLRCEWHMGQSVFFTYLSLFTFRCSPVCVCWVDRWADTAYV